MAIKITATLILRNSDAQNIFATDDLTAVETIAAGYLRDRLDRIPGSDDYLDTSTLGVTAERTKRDGTPRN